ncbi:aminobenzoate oxygenase [Duganella sp. FT92W]|uniref:Aminobenzoate oxygenase n=1 Tax=Pseudoduganella rivuli TaxID=2666085 RepID=A0A7X2IUE7_9BURK|nr:diiron oxygenase [Pseudoduganella rivuli]MRV75668.1 aminobenzoate oxygenase [Pseudoduganella rivuli]
MIQHQYESHSPIWESRATIRSRPRRQIEDDALQYYPIERQPLCLHPLIVELGSEVEKYILIQSLYKYINDIIIFETEIVNRTARSIAKGLFLFDFPFACRYDAMSVVIDEDYHAYVAMDYLNQVQTQTGISPIVMPAEIELSRAIPRTLATLEEKYRDGMELLAVAISENTITADVAAFSRNLTIKRSVKGMMADHLADEGRHSSFWIKLVKIYWSNIDEATRLAIGAALPYFLQQYLTNDIQAEFDRRLVMAIAMPESSRRDVMADMVSSYPITKQHPMMVNIFNFFKASGLLDHGPTRRSLDVFI